MKSQYVPGAVMLQQSRSSQTDSSSRSALTPWICTIFVTNSENPLEHARWSGCLFPCESYKKVLLGSTATLAVGRVELTRRTVSKFIPLCFATHLLKLRTSPVSLQIVSNFLTGSDRLPPPQNIESHKRFYLYINQRNERRYR